MGARGHAWVGCCLQILLCCVVPECGRIIFCLALSVGGHEFRFNYGEGDHCLDAHAICLRVPPEILEVHDIEDHEVLKVRSRYARVTDIGHSERGANCQ
ncbi:hypothetical protein TGPRC2_206910 [Toxoplasma gondii TgCatPRC2]|uniref:Transmembrane protein n=8 Tax=Toxoplasma gondii TaxID=5811 RepID=S7UJW7_TOXGG|nr:hypothetical protein TGGT1_206910 [Toxoplasma gondii GT1]KFG56672.1 hypothetical protein TGRUB_206910 [Toxoplasma gondii RUB]KYF39284.1 hypothetical protein TGARI_206910 [Toxoplasma gondii ARI]KYK66732.1 hypothetical protein TGPRC2_206910 [Toxoplasma gondii TgCatPRC2]